MKYLTILFAGLFLVFATATPKPAEAGRLSFYGGGFGFSLNVSPRGYRYGRRGYRGRGYYGRRGYSRGYGYYPRPYYRPYGYQDRYGYRW
jgi:hypothetical protein